MSPSRLLDGLSVTLLLAASLSLLPCFLLLSNPYAQFPACFSSLLALSHGVLLRVLRRHDTPNSTGNSHNTPSQLIYGVVLGGTSGMLVVYLQMAVFFGQYSDCEEYHSEEELHAKDHYGVVCDETKAMASYSALSVILFLISICLMVVLLKHKDDLLGIEELFEDLEPDTYNYTWASHMDSKGAKQNSENASRNVNSLSLSTDL